MTKTDLRNELEGIHLRLSGLTAASALIEDAIAQGRIRDEDNSLAVGLVGDVLRECNEKLRLLIVSAHSMEVQNG